LFLEAVGSFNGPTSGSDKLRGIIVVEINKESFIYPRGRYYGKWSPEEVVFNANLQELAGRIGILASLHTGGKLETGEAYRRLETLWKEFDAARTPIGIGDAGNGE
jgi:hypothetical protein